jgi:outer membrane protein assembly factor BamB
LDVLTGELVWSFSAEDKIMLSSAFVSRGIVYIGSLDNNIYALNAINGQLIWVYTTGGEVASSPAVVNEIVYVGSYDGKVYALDAKTGADIWSYDTRDMVVSSLQSQKTVFT